MSKINLWDFAAYSHPDGDYYCDLGDHIRTITIHRIWENPAEYRRPVITGVLGFTLSRGFPRTWDEILDPAWITTDL
jgi:hypothetical protein